MSPQVTQRTSSETGLKYQQTKNSRSSSPSSAASSKKSLLHFSKVMYSLPLPNYTPKQGQSIPRRNPVVINEKELTSQYDPNIKTLYDVMQASVAGFGDKDFLGTRSKSESGEIGSFSWKTYRDTHSDIIYLSSGLADLGLKKGDAVGLFSVNRYEWLVGEYACYTRSIVTVPLYDTLGSQSILHICNQTDLSTIISTKDKALSLMKLAKELNSLKRIIIMDSISEELDSAAEAANIDLFLFSNVLKKGKENPVEVHPPSASDICTICYTSGTTGLPKGAVFPHSAMVAIASAVDLLIKNHMVIDLNENEIHLSYLPLAHIFERVVTVILIKVGASIGFYQGDTLKILDDVGELRPTVFVSVPRLYNRIYDKVFSGVKTKGAISQYLFNMAYESKLKSLKQGNLTHWLWDRLVFAPIKSRLGGRVRAMITGSAPIAPEVMDFLRVAFACEVYEGYGQTETCAASCLTQRGDYSSGHVGTPTPCNEIMLIDVPEMSYFASETPCRGEICFRGPNCFTGYYKEPEKTAETIDADGWIHSGDIGEWDAQGRLRLIDRKKNIFKLAQGEYIAPEKIENILSQASLVEQIFIYGDSLKATLIAIVVPDKEALVKAIHSKSLKAVPKNVSSSSVMTFDYLYEHKYQDLVDLVLSDLIQFARSNHSLKGFEIPKSLYLEKSPFSVQNNLLTSTFKLKRFEASKYYKATIDQLYQKMKD